MRKIGLTLSKNNLDASLAQHFGKAKWILIYENSKCFEFVRNENLIGRYVVDIFVQKECSDVICHHIGWGAHRHLQEKGIKTWHGPPKVSAQELLGQLTREELQEVIPIPSSTPNRLRKGRE